MINKESGFFPDEQEQYQDVPQLTFDQIRRGSEIRIFTAESPDKITDKPDYVIKVIGIRKKGLVVEVAPSYKGGGGDFKALIPGSYRSLMFDNREPKPTDIPGIIPGVLEVATPEVASCLYFENLKYIETGAPISRSRITTKIRKILFR